MKLKYTFIVPVDEVNYRDEETPVVTPAIVLEVEKENIDDGLMAWDEVLEGAESVEVEVIDE